MDLTSLIGLAAGALMLVLAMVTGGSLRDFINLPGLAVALGGTVAATMIHFPLPRLLTALRVLPLAFRTRKADLGALTNTLVRYATDARREGVLFLEGEAEQTVDPFMRKGLGLVVDGTDPESIRSILELDLTQLEERHKQGAAPLETMASYAPAFGLVGTLIGLVKMLQDLSDPSQLSSGLASALLTTLYGTLLANLFFLPVVGKLKVRTADEVRTRELMIEAFVAIQAGEGPATLVERLSSYLSPAERAATGKRGNLSEDEED